MLATPTPATPPPTDAAVARSPWWADPLGWVEWFIVANLAFLGVDIAIAHAVNAFEHPAEWVPIGFSAGATVVLLLAIALGGVQPALVGDRSAPARRRLARALGLLVGWGSILVGVAGLLFHLESQFFREQTLRNLVYTAPFAAPLAYAGLGFLLILDRMVPARTIEWARWVVLFALGGFAGNFILSLADHAQNGFFNPVEWVAVIAAALVVGSLTAVLVEFRNRPLMALCFAVLLAQVAVGVLGFALHVRANLRTPLGTLWEKFLYGAPAFAPLLFANLAILAALALWALARAQAEPAPPQPDPVPLATGSGLSGA